MQLCDWERNPCPTAQNGTVAAFCLRGVDPFPALAKFHIQLFGFWWFDSSLSPDIQIHIITPSFWSNHTTVMQDSYEV